MGKRKWDIKKAKKLFKDNGCELLEEVYISYTTKMKYRCDCGNSDCKITLGNFQEGKRCAGCSCERAAEKHRKTIKEVRKIFKKGGCKLLEEVYVNAVTPMRYRCICGNSDCKITLGNFRNGHRCNKCAIKRRADKKRLLYEDVKKYFEDHDCELLETEYINSQTLMRYRCDCGNPDCKISFSSFKAGHRCKKCAIKKRAEKLKFTYEDVKQYFEDHDCELFETEYKNCKTLMRYRCDCGNTKCKITFDSFRSGCRCIECSGKEKHTFEFVYTYFKERKCLLLETKYKNAYTSMKYRCDCGNNKCKISFNNFQQGNRCMKCAIERRSGKNHPNYNPDLTDEEREKGRSCPGYYRWREDVRERDNYTCQYCGETEGVLCTHHIEAYKPNKELRTVLSNGFLFCEKHHVEFHKIYGYNCHRKQLNEFVKNQKILIS